MNLTPEEKKIGQENYQDAVSSLNRRAFLKGTAAAVPGLGAVYFGYKELNGEPVKVGFIGTGDEGSVLLTQHPEKYMNIVAIADLRPSNLKRAFDGDGNEHRVGLRKKLGAEACAKIKTYANHKEMLKNHPEIEAVVIAVPLNVHAQVTIDCLKAGKHVLCEKLMAQNITDCKKMIREAEQAKKLLAVGHQRHYSVLYENANELVQGGLLGDIKFIRASWHRNNSFDGADGWNKAIPKEDAAALASADLKEWGFDSVDQLCRWRLFHKTGGGLMAELGSHQLDACSIFLGKKHPLAIQGYGGRNYYGVKGVGTAAQQKDQREIDDHVYVTLEFPGPHYEEDHNDIVIVTYSSINTNRLEPYGETLFGSRGTMIVELEQTVMLYKEAGPKSPGGTGTRLQVEAKKGGPVMTTADTNAPSVGGTVAAGDSGKVSRGYTEEMEHFCYCIRENNFEPREKGGLRCNGTHAMGDAIMALTANLAMKHKKRIEFKESWFDPKSDDVPETDSQVIG